MPIKKILFFLEQPFDSRNHDRFGVDILQREGFEVSVYDFSPFRYPGLRRTVPANDPPRPVRSIVFDGEEEALAAISRIDRETFVMNFLGYNHETYPIYDALSARSIPYAVNTVNALPVAARDRSRFSRMMRQGWPGLPRLREAARNVIFRRKAKRLKAATFWLAGGSESPGQYFYPRDANTRILWMHSFDYDLYLGERANPDDDHNTAVFLDQYLPFHPDFLAEGHSAPVDSERYFSQVNAFFDDVERTTGLTIEVAAHPRSGSHAGYADQFLGRRVVSGQTASMIRRSRLVIAHYSTAVSLAVLFRKPIAFITTTDLRQSSPGAQVEVMASSLGRRVIDLPIEVHNWQRELIIDARAYERYQHLFISTPHAPELPSWRIVADALKQIA